MKTDLKSPSGDKGDGNTKADQRKEFKLSESLSKDELEKRMLMKPLPFDPLIDQ
jgi:hypothetical protein